MGRITQLALVFLTLCSTACRAPQATAEPNTLSVLSWNIWHGGREDGEQVGPQRVIKVIRDSGADLVAMQETYGSGERISSALGFHFHPRGTNVSIHSRYPIVADISVFEEFQCVGAVIELPNGDKLAFYSIWLPYDAEIWAPGTRAGKPTLELLAACASSAVSLEQILERVGPRLSKIGLADIPIVIAGDFNSMSDLDYTQAARAQYGQVIAWPTSQVISGRGFRDAYRSLHATVNRLRDRTWSPRFPEQQQDRIDYIYDTLETMRVTEARVIDQHVQRFPSDHAALLVRYGWRAVQ